MAGEPEETRLGVEAEQGAGAGCCRHGRTTRWVAERGRSRPERSRRARREGGAGTRSWSYAEAREDGCGGGANRGRRSRVAGRRGRKPACRGVRAGARTRGTEAGRDARKPASGRGRTRRCAAGAEDEAETAGCGDPARKAATRPTGMGSDEVGTQEWPGCTREPVGAKPASESRDAGAGQKREPAAETQVRCAAGAGAHAYEQDSTRVVPAS